MPEKNKLLMFDEASLILGANDDNLKEDLRKIEGIPNASYLVKDHQQVFVFDKLVAEVKKQQDQGSNDSLQELALRLIPISTMAPKEAIESWRVVPEPYLLEKDNTSGDFIIRHKPFDSIIAAVFHNKKDTNKALALLLIGSVLKGDGDFIYHGQSMKLCKLINTALLPLCPLIRNIPESIDSKTDMHTYTRLGNTRFIEGFEPISESLFDEVKSLEMSWANANGYASQCSCNHVETIWKRVHELSFETLNDPKDAVPDYEQEEIVDLRSIYPELSMLTDGSLYEHFDSYQMGCCYIQGWTANRDDSFLFYLLGKLAIKAVESIDAEEIGTMLAYSLLNGDSLNEGFEFSRSWYQYNSAIKRLASRVANAMQFLEKEKKQGNLQGNEITTMMDAFRLGRKFNAKTIKITQTSAQITI
jgi:hypothetical protein